MEKKKKEVGPPGSVRPLDDYSPNHRLTATHKKLNENHQRSHSQNPDPQKLLDNIGCF